MDHSAHSNMEGDMSGDMPMPMPMEIMTMYLY